MFAHANRLPSSSTRNLATSVSKSWPGGRPERSPGPPSTRNATPDGPRRCSRVLPRKSTIPSQIAQRGSVASNFVGYLHDDGYCVYKSAFDPDKVVHVACWAHARRKFVDAIKKEPVFAQEAVDQIARLYAIDSQASERGLSYEGRYLLRKEFAPAVLASFKEWLDVRRTQVLPKSGLGKAINYAVGRWDALGRFLEDGRLELDNNRAERALRPFAIGRKNWMQIGNERGGKTAAIYFSLIGTCKARGIDPKIYLHDVMLRLAEGADAKTLTPKEWQVRHASEVADRRNYVLAKMVAKLAEVSK